MGAERGVTAALALFFFLPGVFSFLPALADVLLPVLLPLSKFSTKHAQIGKHARSIGMTMGGQAPTF